MTDQKSCVVKPNVKNPNVVIVFREKFSENVAIILSMKFREKGTMVVPARFALANASKGGEPKFPPYIDRNSCAN